MIESEYDKGEQLMQKKHRKTCNTPFAKSYGSSQFQHRIITMGEKGKLTVGIIIELCDNDE